MSRVLIVDPGHQNRSEIEGRMRALGHTVQVTLGEENALAEARRGAHDLFILSLALLDRASLDLVRRLKAIPEMRFVAVLVLTDQTNFMDAAELAYGSGCDHLLPNAQLPALESVVASLLGRKTRHDALYQRNRALTARIRDFEEGLSKSGNPTTAAAAAAGDPASVGAGRPDGVLLIDRAGMVQLADRGARELFGAKIIGRNLGSISPSTGLEAFVRDAHFNPRSGFRVQSATRLKGCVRSLEATVVPFVNSDDVDAGNSSLLLLHDVAGSASGDEENRSRYGHALLQRVAEIAFSEDAIKGSSPKAQKLRKHVAAAAATAGHVWVSGERGVGKQLVARIVAKKGAASAAFFHLRCTALSRAGLETELFGQQHAGAPAADRPGLFQLARGGTLFLEEITRLPLEFQDRIARLLERSESEGVGAEPDAAFDLRLIASSSQDLAGLVKQGLFSLRLSKHFTSIIHVPPLRDRLEDLPALVAQFSQVALGGERRPISSEALALMQAHDWPENVAELEFALDQALDQAHDQSHHQALEAHHLPRLGRASAGVAVPASEPAPAPVAPGRRPGHSPGQATTQPWDITADDPISLDLYEKKALIRALDSCSGDKVKTARLLKVAKSTLYRKLRRFGLE